MTDAFTYRYCRFPLLCCRKKNPTLQSEKLVFTGDADDAFARLQLQIMGAFAKFERNIIRQRQAEGIARPKASGVYKGRKKIIGENRIRAMKADGHSVTEISEVFGVRRMTVYRNTKEPESNDAGIG